MHCPRCGQQQVSQETRFCSRCGFLLTGIAQVIDNDGIVPQQRGSFFAPGSPRRRGVKQGAFVALLALLIVPLVAMLSMAVRLGPGIAGFTAVLLTVGGLLRIVYALMFESGIPGGKTLEEKVLSGTPILAGKEKAGELPPARSIPVHAYSPPPGAGNWRDTNDLAPTPGSVTDGTTKLLHEEDDPK